MKHVIKYAPPVVSTAKVAENKEDGKRMSNAKVAELLALYRPVAQAKAKADRAKLARLARRTK